MKTHLVIDLIYTEDEGNVSFAGTQKECNDWVDEQGSGNDHFTYQVVPMTAEELKIYNKE